MPTVKPRLRSSAGRITPRRGVTAVAQPPRQDLIDRQGADMSRPRELRYVIFGVVGVLFLLFMGAAVVTFPFARVMIFGAHGPRRYDNRDLSQAKASGVVAKEFVPDVREVTMEGTVVRIEDCWLEEHTIAELYCGCVPYPKRTGNYTLRIQLSTYPPKGPNGLLYPRLVGEKSSYFGIHLRPLPVGMFAGNVSPKVDSFVVRWKHINPEIIPAVTPETITLRAKK
jgi:hypothetical protein